MKLIQWHLGTEGTIERCSNAYQNLKEAGDAEPRNGVYLVSSTFSGGKVLMLDRHFDRMERSSAILGHSLTVPRSAIRSALRDMREEHGFVECRFRVSVSVDLPQTYLLSMEAYHGVPERMRKSGIVCATAAHSARNNPLVKGTGWIHQRTTLDHSDIDSEAVDEFLLCDDTGNILEGSSSNFYAVTEVSPAGSRTLATAGDGVLAGIVRSVVLELAAGMIEVELRPIRTGEITTIAEAFVTSSSRGVVPVRTIDHAAIPAPGPITTVLAEKYDRWAISHAEPL